MVACECSVTESSGLPTIRLALANQTVTIIIPREKSEECPPCSLHKLKHILYSNRATDWWTGNKTFKISHGALSVMMRGISRSHLQQNYHFPLNPGIILQLSLIPLVNTVPRGGRIESIWGLELNAASSIPCRARRALVRQWLHGCFFFFFWYHYFHLVISSRYFCLW